VEVGVMMAWVGWLMKVGVLYSAAGKKKMTVGLN
jgi:hypothetical protein